MLLLAAFGCSEAATVQDTWIPPEVVPDVKDICVPPEETIEFVPQDAPVYEYVPEEGEFLWACTANEECLSGFCVMTKNGGRCTTQCNEDCPDGWACVEADTKPDLIYICIPRFLTLCDPCHTNDDCKSDDALSVFLDQCLEFPDGAGSFCGADCSTEDSPCPKGYVCQSVSTPGGTFQQCLPETATCECSFLAIQEEKSTGCSNDNDFGSCEGEKTCTVDGLSDCSAAVPAEEMCDDIDNDCDGTLDEGCDDDGDGYCDVDMTTPGTPAICGNGGGDCDDGEPTVFPGATEECDKKDNNCDGVIDDGLCEDGNPCTDDLCDPEEGCSHPFNDLACDDGNSCTANDHCYEGMCEGAEKVCDDGNPCTANLCDPVSEKGCYFVNNSDPCPDEGNQCTLDVCENGACQHKLASGLPCDDENPCTVGDTCNSGQCVAGGPLDCDDDNECTADTCEPAQGCTWEVLNGTPCVYTFVPIICEMPGTCGSNGCVPTPNCQCPNCTFCLCCSGFQLCLDGLFG